MAAKRLLEQLAPYDSSSDDDAVDNEEGEGEEQEVVEKNGSKNGIEKCGEDIDEEEEEEEDMEEDEKLKSPVKKKKPTVSRPNDSDNSSPRSPSLAGLAVETTVSMSKSKKKAPTKPNNKREREPDEKDYSKKKKVAVAEDPKKASGVAVVMWSEEDEIVLLKWMSRYKAKKRTDPNADMGAFYDFIKEKLNPDVTKYKLSDKIRRLKKKYHKNALKIEDDDEDPIFPKPHELRSFQLSKKIWGTDKKDESIGHKKKKELIPTRTPIPTTLKTPTQTTTTGKLSEKYPYLYKSLGFCSMDESIQGISKIMPLIESSVLEGLDRKWKKLEIDEVECLLRKTELINEQSKLLLAILKNRFGDFVDGEGTVTLV